MRSRLYKTSEKKTRKQLYLSIAGIVIVLFLLFRFGIPILTNVSLYLSNNNGVSQQDIANSHTLVAPPILNEPYTATNSATITISGTASSKETILLFVNSSQVDSTPTNTDGTFSFSNVTLTQQQNAIQVKAMLTQGNQRKLSDFSDTWSISYIQKAPNLTIDSPSDGQSFGSNQSTITVKGKTDPDVKVTINNLWAIVDSSGNYSYTLSLQNGDNHITVVATDAAGNTTTKQITVKFSQ